MNYKINYLWEQGARCQNEDSLSIMQVSINHTPALLALVADGVGGMSEGELASGIIANRLKCVFESASYSSSNFNLKSLKKALKRELYSCHHDLLRYARDYDSNLGSTCSLVCLIKNKGFILHIGDSHVYGLLPCVRLPFFQKNMKLLTKDHIDAKGHLTHCIGHGAYPLLYYRPISIKRDSIILLSTDGFHKRLADKLTELDRLLNTSSPDSLLKYLHSLAMRRGEQDNSTAILIQVTKGGSNDNK